MYRSRVASTTSDGSSGGGETRSQPDDVSQSRTYCLSYEGCTQPGDQVDAGQKRDESGVSTSSPSTRPPSGETPNSNFVSASTMPAPAAISAAREYSASVSARSSSARFAPTAATTAEKSIASSCSPASALVDGVNTGEGSREPSTSPAGSATSRMEPVRWYSTVPDPDRYPRATHSTGSIDSRRTSIARPT